MNEVIRVDGVHRSFTVLEREAGLRGAWKDLTPPPQAGDRRFVHYADPGAFGDRTVGIALPARDAIGAAGSSSVLCGAHDSG